MEEIYPDPSIVFSYHKWQEILAHTMETEQQRDYYRAMTIKLVEAAEDLYLCSDLEEAKFVMRAAIAECRKLKPNGPE